MSCVLPFSVMNSRTQQNIPHFGDVVLVKGIKHTSTECLMYEKESHNGQTLHWFTFIVAKDSKA